MASNLASPRRMGSSPTVIYMILLSVGLILGYWMTSQTRAEAHAAGSYYPTHRWAADTNNYIGFFTNGSSLDSTAGQGRMKDGNNAWNNTASAWFDVVDQAGQYDLVVWTGNACDMPLTGIWNLQEAQTGTSAQTSLCRPNASTITRAAIRYDTSGRTWHTSTSTTVPSGSTDLWGVATHENGHANGWGWGFGTCSGAVGHFCQSDPPCSPFTETNAHTMCPVWSTTNQTWWQRTLLTHDTHTFQAAYPA
jgi:hypothetical protein